MALLIDTSLWIDFTRAKSPVALKQFIKPYILHPEAHLAEPVTFELLRHATSEENRLLTRQFQTFPVLTTPADLWKRAAELGQACRKQGLNMGSIDLLIAAVALHHSATLVTFDDDFDLIASVSALDVKLLSRPS
jgi:predicted nucleic acid-binding protein